MIALSYGGQVGALAKRRNRQAKRVLLGLLVLAGPILAGCGSSSPSCAETASAASKKAGADFASSIAHLGQPAVKAEISARWKGPIEKATEVSVKARCELGDAGKTQPLTDQEAALVKTLVDSITVPRKTTYMDTDKSIVQEFSTQFKSLSPEEQALGLKQLLLWTSLKEKAGQGLVGTLLSDSVSEDVPAALATPSQK